MKSVSTETFLRLHFVLGVAVKLSLFIFFLTAIGLDSFGWSSYLLLKFLIFSRVILWFGWNVRKSNGGRNPRYWIWLFVSISICWTIWKACNNVVIDGVLINMPEQVRQVKQTHSWLFFGFFAAYRVCFFSCCWVGVLESPRCRLVEIKCRWQCSCHFGSSWYRMIDSRAFWTMDHIFFVL